MRRISYLERKFLHPVNSRYVCLQGHEVVNQIDSDQPLFRYCLDAFEKFINKRFVQKCDPQDYIPVGLEPLKKM